MTPDAQAATERAWRFRDAALPLIDDAYTFAHFLMRNQADADEAVRECYARAVRHFDSYRGRSIKPWLFAILRSVCHAALGWDGASTDPADGVRAADAPLSEPRSDAVTTGRLHGALIRALVVDLPTPLREAIVLRECCGMSYGEIAEVVGVPIGTVVSRLAGARAMMLVAWKTTNSPARPRPANPARGDADRQNSLRIVDGSRQTACGANRKT